MKAQTFFKKALEKTYNSGGKTLMSLAIASAAIATLSTANAESIVERSLNQASNHITVQYTSSHAIPR